MTLWEGGVRVPAILSWPARLPRGRVSRQVAITMDLTATICAAAGVAPPPDRPLEGIDLLPVLSNKTPEQTRTVFWRYQHAPVSQKSVRQGKWKYLRDSNYDLLFDLESDPGERKDLSFEHPDKVAELKKLLRDWESDVDKSAPPAPIK
jgi:arylsulfatase A-like enzyme